MSGEIIEKKFIRPSQAEVESLPAPGQGRRGKPTWKYKPEYAQAILDFFESFSEDPQRFVKKTSSSERGESVDYALFAPKWPTTDKFARTIGVLPATLVDWSSRYPEFSASYYKCKEIEKQALIDAAYIGLVPPATFAFLSANFTDMKPPKQERELTVSVETAPTQVKDMSDEQLSAAAEATEKLRALGLQVTIGVLPGGSITPEALSSDSTRGSSEQKALPSGDSEDA